jgi:hypothetical protein
MEVKIQCPCGTRFAFDVEPVNGRMPVRVNCPGCGADGTDLANEVIRQKLVATPVAPAAAAVVAAASLPFCPRHLKNPATETCRVCGKPICR